MKRIRTTKRNIPRGFTLIEVLLVLVILGVLAALVVPNLLGVGERANIKATNASIHGLETAAKLYATEHNSTYPASLDDLLNPKDVTTGQQMRRYIEADKIRDPWGQVLNYEWPNTKVQNADKPAIWSNGPNGQNENGGGDDIVNWDKTGGGV